MSDSSSHLETELTFLRTEDGGRRSPVFSGYRPQFYYDGKDWDAEHTYVGIDQVNPGDTVTALLRFFSPENHLGRIKEGMEFQIREGSRVVATGRVTRVFDETLRDNR